MKAKMKYADALAKAVELRGRLAPYCRRIEIAGSLRRRIPEIGDIELVVIPKMTEVVDLFGHVTSRFSLLDEYVRSKFRVLMGADKYQQFLIPGDVTCDLFIQTPETWGINFALRTGSADFSHWLVTSQPAGGALPGNMYVRDALLWCGGKVIPTPEEEDFFRAIGLKWIEPEARTKGLWQRGR